jgi:hypothetical protein
MNRSHRLIFVETPGKRSTDVQSFLMEELSKILTKVGVKAPN